MARSNQNPQVVGHDSRHPNEGQALITNHVICSSSSSSSRSSNTHLFLSNTPDRRPRFAYLLHTRRISVQYSIFLTYSSASENILSNAGTYPNCAQENNRGPWTGELDWQQMLPAGGRVSAAAVPSSSTSCPHALKLIILWWAAPCLAVAHRTKSCVRRLRRDTTCLCHQPRLLGDGIVVPAAAAVFSRILISTILHLFQFHVIHRQDLRILPEIR